MTKVTLIKPGGYMDLVAISAIGVVTVIFSILYPGSLPLALLAFFCIFFAPGWALVGFLFPGPKPSSTEEYSEMTLPERVAASIMVSVLLFAIGSLLLAWSPLELTRATVLIEVLILTVGLCALTLWKRFSLPPGEGVTLTVELPGKGERMNRAEQVVTALVVAGLLFAAAVAVDNVLKGDEGKEPFTELFITGLDGKVSSLPQDLDVGEEGIVEVHIVNRMHDPVNYVLTIGIPGEDGFVNSTISDWGSSHFLEPEDGYVFEISLEDGESYIGEFTFEMGQEGRQPVLFNLDFQEDALEVWLWVNVT